MVRHYYFHLSTEGFDIVVSATLKDWDYKAMWLGRDLQDAPLTQITKEDACEMWNIYEDKLPKALVDIIEEIL